MAGSNHVILHNIPHSTKAIIVVSSYQGISSSNPPKNGQVQGFVATIKIKISPLLVVSFHKKLP